MGLLLEYDNIGSIGVLIVIPEVYIVLKSSDISEHRRFPQVKLFVPAFILLHVIVSANEEVPLTFKLFVFRFPIVNVPDIFALSASINPLTFNASNWH